MAFKLDDLKINKVDFVKEGANPDAHIKIFKKKETSSDHENPLAKALSIITKALGLSSEDKHSESFDDILDKRELDKVRDEIWNYCYALTESLMSILYDDKDADRTASMSESVTQFTEAVSGCIPDWSARRSASVKVDKSKIPADTQTAEYIIKQLGGNVELTKKNTGASEADGMICIEEGDKDVKINKSLLSDEELSALDAILKKAGTEDENGDDPKNKPKNDPPKKKETDPDDDDTIDIIDGKGCGGKKTSKTGKSLDPDEDTDDSNDKDDIYKGLHPAVAEELKRLRKYREDNEDRDLTAVAKKYELIGKDPAKLVPVLKSLKAAGGTAYDDMISVLDEALNSVEKSKMFEETGRNGHDYPGNGAVAKAESAAAEIMKSRPGISHTKAMAEVWESHPELFGEFDNEIGG